MRPVCIRLLRVSFLAMVFLAGNAVAEAIPEYDIKAAFLHKFSLFTEWPSPPDKAMTLCVMGVNPFGNRLDELTRSGTNDMRLAVKYLGSLDNIGQCQILFIAESERHRARNVLAAAEHLSILTVSDDSDLFESGMMVGLFLERDRIVFDINYAQVQKSNLSMSSKLLRLARKVYH
jgi:hypothetical protein